MKTLIYMLLLITPVSLIAQLKVGNNPTTVNADAVFEAEATNKGMLIPRVALTGTNSPLPLSSFTAGMVVYNTATANSSPNKVSPGYYYCDGAQWVSVGATLSNVNITSLTTPEGNTVGQMVYNTNSSGGVPVGPVYWDGTSWVAVGTNTNTTEALTNGTPPVAPYLTGTTGVIYTDTASNSSTLGNQYIWDGSNFISYTPPNSTAFYSQNTLNDAGSGKSPTIYRPGAVGLGNNTIPDASAQLDVNSTSKGFLPPRMTQAQMNAIASPADGLVVYCTDCNPRGLWNYDGVQPAWKSVGANNLPNAVFTAATLSCGGALSGNYQAGSAMTASNTKVITITTSAAGAYSVTTNTQNGVTFSSSGTLLSIGAGVQITMQASGTPGTSGTFTYTTSLAGQTCTFTVNFVNVATFNCGAVAYVNTPGVLINGQNYGGTGATVSLQYSNGNGSAYGSTTVTNQGLTLTRTAGTYQAGAGPYSLVYTLSGTYTGSAGLISFALPEGCTAYLGCGGNISVNHVAGSVAPVTKTVNYGTVWTNLATTTGYPAGGTSKCWITRNLGASTQASNAFDNTEGSAGWYWQFNRKQGYQYTTTRTPNTAWIISISENTNWTSTEDPCVQLMAGGLVGTWRLPTNTEITNVFTNANWANISVAYGSVLKIHGAGSLLETTGVIQNRGTSGGIWGSTQASTTTANRFTYTSSGTFILASPKPLAATIRCIRD